MTPTPTTARRAVCLDTETTGLSAAYDRVCEIAALAFDPLTFEHTQAYHVYINPGVPVPYAAQCVHGLTNERLSREPAFACIAEAFIDFVHDSDVYIHNASFDKRMLDAELVRNGFRTLEDYGCRIHCTLRMARRLRGRGTTNTLDALCRAYGVNTSARVLHGALIDTELLLAVLPHLMKAA